MLHMLVRTCLVTHTFLFYLCECRKTTTILRAMLSTVPSTDAPSNAAFDHSMPLGFWTSLAKRMGVHVNTLWNRRRVGSDTTALEAERMIDEMEQLELIAIKSKYRSMRTKAILSFTVRYIPRHDDERYDMELIKQFISDLAPEE